MVFLSLALAGHGRLLGWIGLVGAQTASMRALTTVRRRKGTGMEEQQDVALVLTPEEDRVLRQLSAGSPPHRDRARAILALSSTTDLEQAALMSGLTVNQVRYWLAMFNRGRLTVFPVEQREPAELPAPVSPGPGQEPDETTSQGPGEGEPSSKSQDPKDNETKAKKSKKNKKKGTEKKMAKKKGKKKDSKKNKKKNKKGKKK